MCMLSQSVPRNARTPFYSFGVRTFFATRLHKQVHVQSIYHLITAWLTGTSLRSQVDYTIIGIIFFDLWELWKHRCKLKFEGGVLDPQTVIHATLRHIQSLNDYCVCRAVYSFRCVTGGA